jgi:hypothetical protein
MLEYRYENKQQYTSIPTYIYNNIHKTFLQESFYSVVFLLKVKKITIYVRKYSNYLHIYICLGIYV